ncbi:hypothetical protein D030_0051A, partial [Vibrio parahaemolyticus AQ3810]
MRPNA